MLSEQTVVILGLHKIMAKEGVTEFGKPLPRRLFQSVQGFKELANFSGR